jgi:hypothetical protein
MTFFAPSLVIRGKKQIKQKAVELLSPHLCYLALVVLLSFYNYRDVCIATKSGTILLSFAKKEES